jgi:aminopeptidase
MFAIPDAELHAYAELIVRVGLNLQPGQRLLIETGTSAPGMALGRAVAASAYRAGAPLVDVIWYDDALLLTRFEHAPRDSFGEVSSWATHACLELIQKGGALLGIMDNDPDLLRGQDQTLVGQLKQARAREGRPVAELMARDAANWTVAAVPSPAWAAAVFPGQPVETQQSQLWQLVAGACRLNLPDPVAAWRAHIAALQARAAYLNERCYTGLHYTAPNTDLTVGLPTGHIWISGQTTSQTGITFTANLPTEEVFTLPHCQQAEGHVTASLPLSTGGTLVENFSLTFAGGQVVAAKAEKGEALLHKILETDPGARRLGEVALVPHSSPIARYGRLFYNTLFDENAASHVALGRAYQFCLQGGNAMDEAAVAAAGGNISDIHVDFMIGSSQMDIDGLRADGSREPLMRAGEWALESA